MISSFSFRLISLPFVVAAATIAGCNNQKTAAGGSTANSSAASGSSHQSSTRNEVVASLNASGDPNTLTIMSPNSRESQFEFEKAFKATHPNVKFKWLDIGGSAEDLRFVVSQFQGKKADQGIGIDAFFGGGSDSFIDMQAQKMLQKLPSSYGVPATLSGMPIRDKDNYWVGAALSSFGILYNKAIMARDNLPVPQKWADMGNPKLKGRVALADPRQSGSAHMAYEIILQSNGWDKGWRVLTQMAGNARAFSKSSSGLLDDVSSGEAVAAPAIDFYASSKIRTAGGEKLGYVEPQGERVITADPIGILRGAPNAKLAQEFVAFVMSPQGQKLWMMPVGTSGGPQSNALGRQPALPSMYKPMPQGSLISSDPYASKNNFTFDTQRSAVRRR
ncbi:MAG TPA: extracellular solute-binding protein, partial [Abditibacteriaceae bacterium]|nr:extracellular solute-binding protein [Abditibacteriaceae bacterium]